MLTETCLCVCVCMAKWQKWIISWCIPWDKHSEMGYFTASFPLLHDPFWEYLRCINRKWSLPKIKHYSELFGSTMRQATVKCLIWTFKIKLAMKQFRWWLLLGQFSAAVWLCLEKKTMLLCILQNITRWSKSSCYFLESKSLPDILYSMAVWVSQCRIWLHESTLIILKGTSKCSGSTPCVWSIHLHCADFLALSTVFGTAPTYAAKAKCNTVMVLLRARGGGDDLSSMVSEMDPILLRVDLVPMRSSVFCHCWAKGSCGSV